MNIASQHSNLNYVSILNQMDCDYLSSCFINDKFTMINKEEVLDGLKITFLTACSDINSIYLLSSTENLEENSSIENIRLTLSLFNKNGEQVGNNSENQCQQYEINNKVYVLSIIDIHNPLELNECNIVLTAIRRNTKTLVKSNYPISNIYNDYQMPIIDNACININVDDVIIDTDHISYNYTVTPNDSKLSYNMLISLNCSDKPHLRLLNLKNPNKSPTLHKFSRLENTNKYYCCYDFIGLKFEDLYNVYFYYHTASVDTTSCNISIDYDLSNGYSGIAHLIKVDRAIDINSKLFKVKEFRIGNITTRIIIEGSLLSISDSVDNVLKLYNGNKKLNLISAKCTSKKTIYEFKTSIQDSNKITVKIADKFI